MGVCKCKEICLGLVLALAMPVLIYFMFLEFDTELDRTIDIILPN